MELIGPSPHRRPPTDEAALLCLLKAGETALAAEGAIGPHRLNAGQLAALGSFSEQAGQLEGAGQGADLRGALQMLHRSISSHLALARSAKYRAASGGLRWTDRCAEPDRLADRGPPSADRRRHRRRQRTADSSQSSGAATPPLTPGSLEDVRWSPSGRALVSPAKNLPAPTPSKEISSVAKIMFDRYDTDGSGSIDKAELAALCAKLGRELTSVQLDGAMAKLDTDGNGSVCIDKFMWWWGVGLSVAALQDETVARLRQAAADGMARRQQVQDVAPTTTAIVQVFGAFDRDGSGTLSVKELSAALRELGLNLDGGGGGLSTKGILARYDGDASRSIDVGEFTQLVLEVHEAVVLHGSGTGKASVIQRERDEMRTTDHMPTGKGTASGKAARAARADGGEKSSPGRRVHRRRSAGTASAGTASTSDADPCSPSPPRNFSGARPAAVASDASPCSGAALDLEPSSVQYEL